MDAFNWFLEPKVATETVSLTKSPFLSYSGGRVPWSHNFVSSKMSGTKFQLQLFFFKNVFRKIQNTILTGTELTITHEIFLFIWNLNGDRIFETHNFVRKIHKIYKLENLFLGLQNGLKNEEFLPVQRKIKILEKVWPKKRDRIHSRILLL